MNVGLRALRQLGESEANSAEVRTAGRSDRTALRTRRALRSRKQCRRGPGISSVLPSVTGTAEVIRNRLSGSYLCRNRRNCRAPPR